MSMSSTVAQQTTINGVQFIIQSTLNGNGIIFERVTVPAALAGTLTTFTNSTTGTVTISGSSNPIITAQVIDLYWSGGSRHGVIVGTVAGQAVPISGGAGNNLPIATTPMQVGQRVVVNLGFIGNNVQLIAENSDTYGYLSYVAAAADIAVQILDPTVNQGTFMWYSGSGLTNPLAGLNPTSIALSHNNTAAAANFIVAIQVSA